MSRLSLQIVDADFAKGDSSVALLGRSPQLHRRAFAQRIQIELHLERERVHFLNFVVMTLGLCLCLATYDPTSQISDIHFNLEKQFKIEQARNDVFNHDDIMDYLQVFIDACYHMAPALIDANTKDAIDFARCTDSEVEDVCRLRYWTLNREIQDTRDQILQDQLGPENVRPSQMDCPGLSNCIDRDSQLQRAILRGVKGRTLGLIPEDPIILNSRLDYSQASLVPLMPVIWQVRSPRRPCEGFGDKYNLGILGAGLCDVDTPCNPETVTSFDGVKPSSSGRDQTFYITYSEDAFYCVDRSEYAEVFYDKSWSPWVSHHDLTVGRETEAVEFDGKPVFYKFVSDIAYLQRPISGTLQVDANYCSGFSSIQSSCHEGHGTVCDPYDESHPMWAETANSLLYSNCSLRGEWTKRYLQTPVSRREKSFVTLETTELTVAVLVITPQIAAYRDVQTLIRVIFTFGQGGTIEPTVSLMSTSQTWWWWYIIAGTCVCSALVYILTGLIFCAKILREPPEVRRLHKQRLRTVICDVLVGLLVFSLIVTLFMIDLLPPDVTQELIDAFQTNRQSEYFDVLQDIVSYNEKLQNVKGVVFVVACFLFLRLGIFLSLHPRLGVFLNTLAQLGAHMAEWCVYFSLMQFFLIFIAWWMFGGERHIQYGTLSRSAWTGLQMFMGDFNFRETETDMLYIAYLCIYDFSISLILLNIFLALVIDAFEEVKQYVLDNPTEMGILRDVFDVTVVALWRRKHGFPDTQVLWDYLMTSGMGFHAEADKTPAITATELYIGIVDVNKQQVFSSVDHAQDFINHYVYKIVEEGCNVLAELREDLTFKDGERWTSPDSDAGKSEKFLDVCRMEPVDQLAWRAAPDLFPVRDDERCSATQTRDDITTDEEFQFAKNATNTKGAHSGGELQHGNAATSHVAKDDLYEGVVQMLSNLQMLAPGDVALETLQKEAHDLETARLQVERLLLDNASCMEQLQNESFDAEKARISQQSASAVPSQDIKEPQALPAIIRGSPFEMNLCEEASDLQPRDNSRKSHATTFSGQSSQSSAREQGRQAILRYKQLRQCDQETIV